MNTIHRDSILPLYVGVAFLLCAISAILFFILRLNDGFFVYTLDDPYIHLALAENIMNGHYGINMSEFSAPSSSILWPFIIAPLSNFPISLLLINTACSIAIIVVLVKTLNISLRIEDKKINTIFYSTITILFILATNVIGLIYTGMEHSLQMLLVLIVAYGLIVEIEKKKVMWWLLVAIITAPLIRYECAAISAGAILFLVIRGHTKQAVSSLLLISALVGGFTVFLLALGLDPLPTSVSAKSSIVRSGGTLHSILLNMMTTLTHRQGIILSFAFLIVFSYCMLGKDRSRRQIALVTALALFGHFIAGRYGWYNRYEIYIWSFTIFICIYIFAPSINKLLAPNNRPFTPCFLLLIATGITGISAVPYILDLFNMPIASNNIYQQHYQMHRFAANYYNKPAAVNDLGYVSYKNDNYILDLWGLGSEKALQLRLSGESDWIKALSDEKNIGLVMIYDDWFKDINVPDEWLKIGELSLGNKAITTAHSEVSFYATTPDAKDYIENKLRLFIDTLPEGVRFIYTKRSD